MYEIRTPRSLFAPLRATFVAYGLESADVLHLSARFARPSLVPVVTGWR